jgi:competence protein ComEA
VTSASALRRIFISPEQRCKALEPGAGSNDRNLNPSRRNHMFRNILISLLAAFAMNAFAAVDVNRASQAELESVKGIGPGLSTKILDARKTGEFKNWGDVVERVSGVGPGNAARFSQNGLTVGGATFDGAAAPSAKKADKAVEKPAEKKAKPAAQ